MEKNSKKIFFLIAIILTSVYMLWLLAFWPGVLGQDSLAIMLEVETNRVNQAGKPAFWYLYNLLLYGPWRLVEIPILVQMSISIIVSLRILYWLIKKNFYKSFWYCLFFVSLAPSVIYYSIALYSDGIYTMAMMGMLFEIWICSRKKIINKTSSIILIITVPFALFARPNGIINILAIVFLLASLPNLQKYKLLILITPGVLIAFFANNQYKYHTPIGNIFPLALYETVGFMEHRPMGLWEHDKPRISPKSAEALTSSGASLKNILEFHDPYYWDPLIFSNEGPKLLYLSKEYKGIIIKEFFKYNLWHNFPAFMASRVNIFLYASFANGGIPPPESSQYIISQTESKSSILFRNYFPHKTLMPTYNFMMEYRGLFWTPWFGLILIFITSIKSYLLKDKSSIIVCSIFIIQLSAVFIFSIAGEYRYLLSFFTAPIVLLPIYTTLSQEISIKNQFLNNEK